MKCRYCPRPLRTAESKARGYGLICGRKRGLIPPAQTRQQRAMTQVTPGMTPDIHPGQTAIPIPIQPQLPSEDLTP
ncbi:DUF6011 domain-containing protein [Streptomyces sp. NPDC047000]|uniref:DUF6011 domain-containing protein n=1 Tax=Streptomyces sp. NPDC047000 TaxID=3155474 RepID=UPI0034024265